MVRTFELRLRTEITYSTHEDSVTFREVQVMVPEEDFAGFFARDGDDFVLFDH